MTRLELRYLLALVTGAGGPTGRGVAVALSRAGAAVLCADPDLAAAEETAALVRRARVAAWTVQSGLADELDVRLLVARARDLGGADLLVVADGGAAGPLLAAAVRAEAGQRIHRRPGTPRVLVLDPERAGAGDEPDAVVARLRCG